MGRTFDMVIDFSSGKSGFREKRTHVVAVKALDPQAALFQLIVDPVSQRLFPGSREATEPEDERRNLAPTIADFLPKAFMDEIKPHFGENFHEAYGDGQGETSGEKKNNDRGGDGRPGTPGYCLEDGAPFCFIVHEYSMFLSENRNIPGSPNLSAGRKCQDKVITNSTNR